MKRVLFVDDEPEVLEGLQALLRRHRHQWEMVFSCGGREGMRQLDTAPFDVIVTDMKMPEVDGATLLGYAQEHFPYTVRIILSGQIEQNVARRMVRTAHLFLSKPCEPGVLEAAVERACSLNLLLQQESLRALVGKIDLLPSLPGVYQEMIGKLEDPNVSMREIAAIVKNDAALSAKVLQIVNSAFFGIAQNVTEIEQAVTHLGADVLRGLTMMVEVFETPGAGVARYSVENLQRHAVMTAQLSRRVVEDKSLEAGAFVAGMLHDIGILIMLTRMPDEFSEILETARRLGLPLHVVEKERMGATHAEMGAYLLGLWGLPYAIVEAVAHHHEPSRLNQPGMEILTAVHVASSLVGELDSCLTEAQESHADPIDMRHLESMGVAGRLPQWRELAAEALTAAATERP